MPQTRATNNWAPAILVVVALGLGTPIYERAREWLKDDLGGAWSFVVAVLAAVIVAIPVVYAIHRIIDRELSGRGNDLLAMIYRPAIFPLWVFAVAVLKNLDDLKEPAPWVYLLTIMLLLVVSTGIQKKSGKPWSWWLALPVSVLASLVSLPIAMGIAHLASGP